MARVQKWLRCAPLPLEEYELYHHRHIVNNITAAAVDDNAVYDMMMKAHVQVHVHVRVQGHVETRHT